MDQITDEFGDMIPAKSHSYINKLYGPPEQAFQHHEESTDPLINIVYNRYEDSLPIFIARRTLTPFFL
jgi:tyrosinase